MIAKIKNWMVRLDKHLSKYWLYRAVKWLGTPASWLVKLAKKYPKTAGVVVVILLVLPFTPITLGVINILTAIFNWLFPMTTLLK